MVLDVAEGKCERCEREGGVGLLAAGLCICLGHCCCILDVAGGILDRGSLLGGCMEVNNSKWE